MISICYIFLQWNFHCSLSFSSNFYAKLKFQFFYCQTNDPLRLLVCRNIQFTTPPLINFYMIVPFVSTLYSNSLQCSQDSSWNEGMCLGKGVSIIPYSNSMMLNKILHYDEWEFHNAEATNTRLIVMPFDTSRTALLCWRKFWIWNFMINSTENSQLQQLKQQCKLPPLKLIPKNFYFLLLFVVTMSAIKKTLEKLTSFLRNKRMKRQEELFKYTRHLIY